MWFFTVASWWCYCSTVPIDLNRDNPHFSEQVCLQLKEADYLESADQSDQEARRVLAAVMMLQEIPHFSQPEVHLVLFINIFKYMAFLQMQESRRVTVGEQKKLLKTVQMARNYQVAKYFDLDDPSQPTSAIIHTPPGPGYNLVSKRFTSSPEYSQASLHPDSN